MNFFEKCSRTTLLILSILFLVTVWRLLKRNEKMSSKTFSIKVSSNLSLSDWDHVHIGNRIKSPHFAFNCMTLFQDTQGKALILATIARANIF